MAETIYYHLKPPAEAELVRRKRELFMRRRMTDAFGRPMLSSDEVRAGLDRLNREFYRREFMEVADDERIVDTRCTGCGRLHQMLATVTYYKCPCDPHTERNALNDRAVTDAVSSLRGSA